MKGVIAIFLDGIAAAKASATSTAIPVDELVKDAVAACHYEIDTAGAEVVVEIAPDLIKVATDPGGVQRVVGDATALRSALQNLISNAIKYGGPKPWVRITAASLSHKATRITVEDHGIGIAAEDRTHIFEPFYRGREAVSRQIHAIFADYTPLIEPLSLDEAYLDVTDNLRGIPTASATAKEIRARILEETGLTASAGISYCKFIAKLASDQNKPDGLCVIPPHRAEAFIATLPVSRFHGVGPVTARKMERLGIVTGADLAAWPQEQLEAHFGSSGRWVAAGIVGPLHR